MTAGNGLTVSYASYNKPASITRGTTTIGFSHDPEHQRFQQTAPGGTTLYLGNAEKFTGSGGAVRWTNYLMASGGVVAMHVENSDETVAPTISTRTTWGRSRSSGRRCRSGPRAGSPGSASPTRGQATVKVVLIVPPEMEVTACGLGWPAAG